MKNQNNSFHWRAAALSGLAALCLSVPSAHAADAVVGTFTGGDPGEGLDLEGRFTYALNIGPSGAAGKAGDAIFTADNVVGVNIFAVNNIGNGGWLAATYGDTEADNALETVMNSIRWSGAPEVVTIRLRVETGIDYKLQLLVGENCCPGRGFNVEIDGITEVANFMAGPLQTGEGDFAVEKNLVGAVITKELTATSQELVIVLNGPAADDFAITDRNAIINGLTLERLSPISDDDNDGLPDDWEGRFFGNLLEAGSGDPDEDDLSNSEELTLGTDPTRADTDGDGLEDGAEVRVHNTNPSLMDTDADALSDGDEINRYGTNPAKMDTDDDGSSDFAELRFFTDPKVATSKPTRTTVGVFTGGDPDEGLDLQGNFIYAVDNASEGAEFPGMVGDANFTGEVVEGVTVVTRSKTANNWNPGINYGDTANDDLLEAIMGSISWSDWNFPVSDVRITLSNLTPGAPYKLQLLFAEQAWPRAMDVFFDGAHLADDFSHAFFQSGGFPLTYPDDRGVVLTHTFVARGTEATLKLDGKTSVLPQFTDHNALINAFTLEKLGEAADTDGDGLPDAWENDFFGGLSQTASGDPDGDTVANSVEYADGTDPSKADTDNDGLRDNQEKTAATNPRAPDSDHDGLNDGAEVNTHSSNPILADSDSDGISDALEIQRGTNPNKSETRGRFGAFTGGDVGEGLDLDGTFLYAFSVLPDTGAQGQVRDAFFTSENVDGVVVSRATAQAAGWFQPNFGDTTNDDTLEFVVQNIRHSGGGVRIELSNLIPGALYKLQLIFGEQCCARAMDILVDGKLVGDEFAPFILQQGINNQAVGAVFTYEFVASQSTVLVETQGSTVTTARYTDRNPTINAVTLEQTAANSDSDSDGLSDAWEIFHFENLSAGATADPDSDGLNNLGEFQFGTNPLVADADGDGLNDNDERLAGTNPSLADTDGDTLNDGAEVKTHGTNPLAVDPDNDGLPDATELAMGKDPNVADTGVHVGMFTGGDVGEGLDLDGQFLYAFSIVPDSFAVGQVRDAVFTVENVPGVTVSQANSQIMNWFVPEFGDSPNDDMLEFIVPNIRHGGGGATIALEGLEEGKAYKLQLLFVENCCARAMDIRAGGQLIADEFAPFVVQGGINAPPTSGAVVSYEFVANTNRLVIQTVGATVTTPRYTDRNPIINAVTLEDLGQAPPSQPRITGFSLQGGLTFTFQSVAGRAYTLQYRANLSTGDWADVTTVTAAGASSSISDTNPTHLSGPTGFWRLKTQ